MSSINNYASYANLVAVTAPPAETDQTVSDLMYALRYLLSTNNGGLGFMKDLEQGAANPEMNFDKMQMAANLLKQLYAQLTKDAPAAGTPDALLLSKMNALLPDGKTTLADLFNNPTAANIQALQNLSVMQYYGGETPLTDLMTMITDQYDNDGTITSAGKNYPYYWFNNMTPSYDGTKIPTGSGSAYYLLEGLLSDWKSSVKGDIQQYMMDPTNNKIALEQVALYLKNILADVQNLDPKDANSPFALLVESVLSITPESGKNSGTMTPDSLGALITAISSGNFTDAQGKEFAQMISTPGTNGFAFGNDLITYIAQALQVLVSNANHKLVN